MFEKLFNKLGDMPLMQHAKLNEFVNAEGSAVLVVNAPLGSGKTLTVPTQLVDMTSRKVLLMEPTRFLAMNVSDTIASLDGSDTVVGYGVGHRGGEQSTLTGRTKLDVVTYGYALATADRLKDYGTIVIDEAHETSLDLSILMALIHHRMRTGIPTKLVVMSGTMDYEAQATYWRSASAWVEIIHTEERLYPCEFVQINPATRPLSVVALELMGRCSGALVFLDGIAEAEAEARKFETLLQNHPDLKIEVGVVTSRSEVAQRRFASAPPLEGYKKIVFGTNVMESGVNLPWVDAGITNGVGKINTVVHGSDAVILTAVPLDQGRLSQQRGRVCRFKPGIFVLYSDTPLAARPTTTPPELTRLPVDYVMLQVARYNFTLDDLDFPSVYDNGLAKTAAMRLRILGLVDCDGRLTDAGRFVVSQSVGIRPATMLRAANTKDELKLILPVAVALEVGDIRHNWAFPGRFRRLSVNSDLVDVAATILDIPSNSSRDLFEEMNIRRRAVVDAWQLLNELSRRLIGSSYDPAWFSPEDNWETLQKLILAGFSDMIHYQSGEGFIGVIDDFWLRQDNQSSVYADTYVVATRRCAENKATRRRHYFLTNVTGIAGSIIQEYFSDPRFRVDVVSNMAADIQDATRSWSMQLRITADMTWRPKEEDTTCDNTWLSQLARVQGSIVEQLHKEVRQEPPSAVIEEKPVIVRKPVVVANYDLADARRALAEKFGNKMSRKK